MPFNGDIRKVSLAAIDREVEDHQWRTSPAVHKTNLPIDVFMKTILIVNDFAHVNGGAGQVALSSAIGLVTQGYKVIVLSAVGPIMPELISSNVKVIVTGHYEIIKDPNRLRAVAHGIWNPNAHSIMKDLLSILDPKQTIVHIHGWTKALSSSVIRIAVQRGFKVICTLHDYFSACPNGGFFDYQRKEICTENPLSARCILKNCDVRSYSQKLWRVARQVAQSRLGMMPDGIRHFITISDFSEMILQPFLPQDAMLFRVDNPISALHRPCINAGANDALTFVGRLSSEKGVEMFAAAANRLGIAPTFVGAGTCEEIIKKVCPQAKITGWLSPDRVTEYLSVARALVLPSLCYETQGLVVAEAAALGIPALVPDTCAAKDMVKDGETGLWFRGGDENDLLNKMKILQRPGIATKLGNAAYEGYWREPHTIERHIAKLGTIYKHILPG